MGCQYIFSVNGNVFEEALMSSLGWKDAPAFTETDSSPFFRNGNPASLTTRDTAKFTEFFVSLPADRLIPSFDLLASILYRLSIS